jgi:hypothetical protein
VNSVNLSIQIQRMSSCEAVTSCQLRVASERGRHDLPLATGS